MNNNRFSIRFKLFIAIRVVDNGEQPKELAKEYSIGRSTIERWARQLRLERSGTLVQGTPFTIRQQKLKSIDSKLKQIEEDTSELQYHINLIKEQER
jgi:transposase